MGDKKFLNEDKQWEYSKLSALAKEHGGPEDLLDDVYDEGHTDGRLEGQVEGGIYAVAVMGAIGVATVATNKIRKYFKKRSEKKKQELHKEYNETTNAVEECCPVCGKITRFCLNGENWGCQNCGEYKVRGEHIDSEEGRGEE